MTRLVNERLQPFSRARRCAKVIWDGPPSISNARIWSKRSWFCIGLARSPILETGRDALLNAGSVDVQVPCFHRRPAVAGPDLRENLADRLAEPQLVVEDEELGLDRVGDAGDVRPGGVVGGVVRLPILRALGEAGCRVGLVDQDVA